MKTHKYLFWITLFLSIGSFVTTICLHSSDSINSIYWNNIFLAVFGSSLIVMLSSIAGYFIERRRYLLKLATFSENFSCKVSNAEQFIICSNPPVVEAYREINLVINFYDSFALENQATKNDSFFKNRSYRKTVQSLYDYINSLQMELLDRRRVAEKSLINHCIPYTFVHLLNDNELQKLYSITKSILKHSQIDN